MPWVDLGTIVLLVCAVALWWYRSPSRRLTLLTGLALVTATLSAVAVVKFRWQAAPSVFTAGLALAFLLAGRFRPRIVTHGWGYATCGLVLSALTVVSALAFYWFPIVDLPKPSGPYPVGVRDFALTDPSRIGLFDAAPDQPRKLSLRVWYPAETIEGYEVLPYFSRLEAETTARGLGDASPLGSLFFPYLMYSDTRSYIDAPLRAGVNKRPTVIFSHGYRGFKGQNTQLMEHLASHGYIAYAVQHTYESSPTVFPDGEVAWMDPGMLQTIEDYQAELQQSGYRQELIDVYTSPDFAVRRSAQLTRYRSARESGQRLATFSAPLWLADRQFVHNALESGEVPARVRDIVAASNWQATGQIGMSFGGSVAAAVCLVDTRCAAVVNIDGDERHQTPFNTNMPAPMLVLHSDLDFRVKQFPGGDDEVGQGITDFAYERHETVGLRADLYRLWVKETSHYALSDFSIFLSRNGNRIALPLFGPLDGRLVNRIHNDVVRSFLDKYLRGADIDYPAALARQYDPWVAPQDLTELREWWLEEHPEDATVRVVLKTAQGDIALALYPERAPRAVARFLQLVDGRQLDGVSFQPAATGSHTGREVLTVAALPSADGETPADGPQSLPLESPAVTGIPLEAGVVAFGSPATGQADPLLVFSLDDQGDRGEVETFGRILSGLRMLQSRQRGAPAAIPELPAPLVIERAIRREPPIRD